MVVFVVTVTCVMISLFFYRFVFPKKRMFREIDFNYRPYIGRK